MIITAYKDVRLEYKEGELRIILTFTNPEVGLKTFTRLNKKLEEGKLYLDLDVIKKEGKSS